MRILTCLILTVLSFGTAQLSAASLAEKQQPHDVQLADLINRPQAYVSMRVRFRATFV